MPSIFKPDFEKTFIQLIKIIPIILIQLRFADCLIF